MQRRKFIALLGRAVAVWPCGAGATIPASCTADFPTLIHVLLASYGALGYEDGHTAAIELLGGEGDPDRLDTLLAAQS